jgi:2-polyprenyl-3-methyl-5-hydroxy-6-metoxy-1,4-benzoquinol methylase
MTEGFLVDGRRVDEAECRQLFDSPLPDRMKQVLQRVHGPRLLDVGCYDASFLDAVVRSRSDLDAVATDYDPENLRIARFLRPELASQVVEASVYDLPFEDDRFDCVTFQEVIEHLEGAALALKELNRVLRPGGTLLLSTPNAYYWRDFLVHARSELAARVKRRAPRLENAVYYAASEWNRHIHTWTPTTLLTLLEVNGFRYSWHGFSDDERRFGASTLMRVAPFLGPVLIIEVHKVANAPRHLT